MARKSRLQSWVEYVPVRLLLAALGVLPRAAAIKCGVMVARFIFSFGERLSRIGIKNLDIAFPEKSAEQKRVILSRSIDNLGRVLGELSQFPRMTPEGIDALVEFDFESPETLASDERRYYDAQRAKGRGIILASPHLGNWEIGVFAYSALREPISYLARPLDNPLLEDLLAGIRARFGNRAINKTRSVGTAIDVLKSGGLLGILPDVNVQLSDGVFVPFFGVPASTTRGVAMLAMRTGAMIVPMSCIWSERKQKYVVRYGSIIEPPQSGDRHRDIVDITAAMTLEIERFIRDAPEQWIWTHKRWKTRPEGEPETYY